MFELVRQASKLTHVQIRWEYVGKSGRPASGLKLQVKAGNQILDKLSPHLRGCFYKFDDETPQKEMIGLELTKLLHPLLQKTFTYAYKGAGYKVIIEYGTNDEPIELNDCIITDFTITAQDGGTVVLEFTVQFHQRPGEIDLLSNKQQQEITVTLIAPEVKPEVADLIGDKPSELAKLEARRAKKKGLTEPEPPAVDPDAPKVPEGATIN